MKLWGVFFDVLVKQGRNKHLLKNFRGLVNFLFPLRDIILLKNRAFNFVFMKGTSFLWKVALTVCRVSLQSFTNDIYLLQCSRTVRKCHFLPYRIFVNFSEMRLSSFSWGEKMEKRFLSSKNVYWSDMTESCEMQLQCKTGSASVWAFSLFSLNALDERSWICQISWTTSANVGRFFFFFSLCLMFFFHKKIESFRLKMTLVILHQAQPFSWPPLLQNQYPIISRSLSALTLQHLL